VTTPTNEELKLHKDIQAESFIPAIAENISHFSAFRLFLNVFMILPEYITYSAIVCHPGWQPCWCWELHCSCICTTVPSSTAAQLPSGRGSVEQNNVYIAYCDTQGTLGILHIH